MRDRLALRVTAGATLIAGAALLRAQTVDLVDHNGFEDCWSKAITKTAFLDLLQSTIDAQTFCIAQSSISVGGFDISACNTAACAGNAIGCSVTTHAGSFNGDFGTGAFSATGTADDLSIPISYTGLSSGSCTVTVSSVALAYSPSYFVQADGNNGDYMAYLTQSAINVTGYVPSADTCSLLVGLFAPALIGQIETAASAEFGTLLDATTVGESVCPLTP